MAKQPSQPPHVHELVVHPEPCGGGEKEPVVSRSLTGRADKQIFDIDHMKRWLDGEATANPAPLG